MINFTAHQKNKEKNEKRYSASAVFFLLQTFFCTTADIQYVVESYNEEVTAVVPTTITKTLGDITSQRRSKLTVTRE